MKNILTEALVNSATNASFIFSYTNSAKLRGSMINVIKLRDDEPSGYYCLDGIFI